MWAIADFLEKGEGGADRALEHGEGSLGPSLSQGSSHKFPG